MRSHCEKRERGREGESRIVYDKAKSVITLSTREMNGKPGAKENCAIKLVTSDKSSACTGNGKLHNRLQNATIGHIVSFLLCHFCKLTQYDFLLSLFEF